MFNLFATTAARISTNAYKNMTTCSAIGSDPLMESISTVTIHPSINTNTNAKYKHHASRSTTQSKAKYNCNYKQKMNANLKQQKIVHMEKK